MILSKVNITYTYTSIKCRPYFVPSHIRRARIDGQTDTGGQTVTGGQIGTGGQTGTCGQTISL